VHNLANEILKNKRDLWGNKITNLKSPITVYIKQIDLQACTALAYLDKENNLLRSFNKEEKFQTMIFDQKYNTKTRLFYQKYRIFALSFFVIGLLLHLYSVNTTLAYCSGYLLLLLCWF
jgi:hypothetical protein